LKINPTPFCVLDEVDAALDEANVQRFANLLDEFARRIQFIVVTHNRATMDKANVMYGVSMDAAGVSHVFSVKPGAVAEAAHRIPPEDGSATPEESDLVESAS
jgi:chromosome segregation protein